MKKIKIYQYYKIANSLYKKKHRFLAKLIYIFMRVVFSCDIPYTSKIGEGTQFPHFALGVVINPDAIIGKGCHINQHVTIGGRSGQNPPRIGNNVLIGANALILGDISIGDNAQIGAGAVVVKSVPKGAIVVGNPARIINTMNFEG
jgi:serine O-acetyltransferase